MWGQKAGFSGIALAGLAGFLGLLGLNARTAIGAEPSTSEYEEQNARIRAYIQPVAEAVRVLADEEPDPDSVRGVAKLWTSLHAEGKLLDVPAVEYSDTMRKGVKSEIYEAHHRLIRAVVKCAQNGIETGQPQKASSDYSLAWKLCLILKDSDLMTAAENASLQHSLGNEIKAFNSHLYMRLAIPQDSKRHLARRAAVIARLLEGAVARCRDNFAFDAKWDPRWDQRVAEFVSVLRSGKDESAASDAMRLLTRNVHSDLPSLFFAARTAYMAENALLKLDLNPKTTVQVASISNNQHYAVHNAHRYRGRLDGYVSRR